MLKEKEESLTPELKKAEEHLIEILIETERTSVHLRLGFSSLFKYATECLKLSEATSYNAIAVARKAREVPELKKEIQEIGISKMRRIVSVLTRENQKEWFERAKGFSSRALEKAVAKENPREATPESAKYVSEKRLDLRLGVSEALMLKVRRAQDQVSRSLGKSGHGRGGKDHRNPFPESIAQQTVHGNCSRGVTRGINAHGSKARLARAHANLGRDRPSDSHPHPACERGKLERSKKPHHSLSYASSGASPKEGPERATPRRARSLVQPATRVEPVNTSIPAHSM